MKASKLIVVFLTLVFLLGFNSIFAQEEEEQIRYYQMEPLG
jgi:hypothetical protein